MNNFGFLGICSKAGCILSGSFQVEKGIQTGEACFVLIASDASDNTRKKFVNKCDYYGIPYMITGTMDILSRAIGKKDKAVIAVTDSRMAEALMNKLGNER